MPTISATQPPTAQPGVDRDRTRRIRAALLSLSRAVQQAAIYPPQHPSLAKATDSFADAIELLVADGPVRMAVTPTALRVSDQSGESATHDAPWLAARLFERQV